MIDDYMCNKKYNHTQKAPCADPDCDKRCKLVHVKEKPKIEIEICNDIENCERTNCNKKHPCPEPDCGGSDDGCTLDHEKIVDTQDK